jgi:hypothetical protein
MRLHGFAKRGGSINQRWPSERTQSIRFRSSFVPRRRLIQMKRGFARQQCIRRKTRMGQRLEATSRTRKVRYGKNLRQTITFASQGGAELHFSSQNLYVDGGRRLSGQRMIPTKKLRWWQRHHQQLGFKLPLKRFLGKVRYYAQVDASVAQRRPLIGAVHIDDGNIDMREFSIKLL